MSQPPWKDEFQAVLLYLRRFPFISVVQLLSAAQDIAAGHVDGCPVFIKEGGGVALPGGVAKRIVASAALGQPEVPVTVNVGVVHIKNRVLRRCGDPAHQPPISPCTLLWGLLSMSLCAVK